MENKGPEIKKTEKLATAIYMLTSFFDEKEPMKWRLRELSAKLVSLHDNQAVVQEIMSLLTVAKHAGLITDMNFEIIHKEFARLLPEPSTFQNLLLSEATKPVTSTEVKIPNFYTASSVPVKDKPTEILSMQKAPLKEFGAVAVKKNNRQSVIIGLLKRKKEIMIKDVSPLIDGVSEKTIQRELLAMVQSGILKKEGEKRWSRYSLAQ